MGLSKEQGSVQGHSHIVEGQKWLDVLKAGSWSQLYAVAKAIVTGTKKWEGNTSSHPPEPPTRPSFAETSQKPPGEKSGKQSS